MCHVPILNKTVTTKSFGYTSDKFKEQRENPNSTVAFCLYTTSWAIYHSHFKIISAVHVFLW